MTPIVVDLSHHNTLHDFAAAKAAGIVGVIHKATQGIGYSDPMYAARRKLATDAGLMWGAYAFNSGEPVSKQVDSFFAHAEPDERTLMALDFEDNPHSQMTVTQARQFLTLADDRLGRKCWIYSGNRIKDLLGNKVDAFFGLHPLWLAQYGPVAKLQPSWTRYSLWQYGEHGSVPGIGGAVDVNFVPSVDQLRKEWV